MAFIPLCISLCSVLFLSGQQLWCEWWFFFRDQIMQGLTCQAEELGLLRTLEAGPGLHLPCPLALCKRMLGLKGTEDCFCPLENSSSSLKSWLNRPPEPNPLDTPLSIPHTGPMSHHRIPVELWVSFIPVAISQSTGFFLYVKVWLFQGQGVAKT